MKVTKEGKLKIERNDYRVGNFVYTVERGHIKVQDINSMFSHRVSRATAKGEMLLVFIKDKADQALMNYASVMYNILGIVPDNEYLAEINRLTIDCMNRHKDLYGIKENLTDEEDEKILKDTKGFTETVEMLKEGAE